MSRGRGRPIETASGRAVATPSPPRNSALEAWRTAQREVGCVMPDALLLEDLSGQHMHAIAMSAAARILLDLSVDEWQAHICAACDQRQTSLSARPGDAAEVVRIAYNAAARAACDAGGPNPRPTGAKEGWGSRVPGVLRAMLRYAASTDRKRYGAVADFTVPPDLAKRTAQFIVRLGATVQNPYRPRYPEEAIPLLMQIPHDVRYQMLACVASRLNGVQALRLLRSNIDVRGNGGVFVRRNTGGQHNPVWSWTALGAREAHVVRHLLATAYADIDREHAERGQDYRVVADVRRRDDRLTRVRNAVADPKLPGDVALLDPRAKLLVDLGPEGGGGQVIRAMRSHLKEEGHAGELMLQIPGEENKRTPEWLLAPSQVAAVSFAMEVGHLAELEAAYRAGRLADYPLFPAGKLRDGRAHCGGGVLQPVDRTTMNTWVQDIETVLQIPHVDDRGWHGWRRSFADLFQNWTDDRRVRELITGHAALHEQTHGDTLDTVYLNEADLPMLRDARRLCEYVRTDYARTGKWPPWARRAQAIADDR